MTNNSNWLHREPSTEEALLCPVPLGNWTNCPVELWHSRRSTLLCRVLSISIGTALDSLGIGPAMFLGLWFLANDSALEQRTQIQLGSNKAIIIVKTILGNYYKKTILLLMDDAWRDCLLWTSWCLTRDQRGRQVALTKLQMFQPEKKITLS